MLQQLVCSKCKRSTFFSNRLLVFKSGILFGSKYYIKELKAGLDLEAEPLCTKHFVLVCHTTGKIVIVLFVMARQ